MSAAAERHLVTCTVCTADVTPHAPTYVIFVKSASRTALNFLRNTPASSSHPWPAGNMRLSLARALRQTAVFCAITFCCVSFSAENTPSLTEEVDSSTFAEAVPDESLLASGVSDISSVKVGMDNADALVSEQDPFVKQAVSEAMANMPTEFLNLGKKTYTVTTRLCHLRGILTLAKKEPSPNQADITKDFDHITTASPAFKPVIECVKVTKFR